MRQFVLYASRAVTSPEFSLDDLPGSGGRMDLVARCVGNALWLSHALRRDTCIHVVACGEPHPPVVLTFAGERLRGVSPDERNIAAWIRKTLAGTRRNPGIRVRTIGFQELIEELAGDGTFFYVVHENGTELGTRALREHAAFVLGDHVGLPPIEEAFVERFEHEKISLGPISYLASHCVTILHYELDKREPGWRRNERG
ncbi:MAG TPA: tRNA (pseudouridine(54)-N(1))-methyltransferase TrmY [Methanomicrobia archaeon]|nr:tRNA (pseudouridine(54)-N(1))-methyltransferase TrmY [Methanomicrobia archaeon]